MPQIFDRICIWALWWSFPPVDGLFHKKCLCMTRGVLRIIILHELVSSWIYITYERNEVLVEYGGIHWSIHNTIKNAHPCGSTTIYPCPNVNFHWVLWTWFVTGLLAPLVAVEATMGLHLHTRFICPYDILERSPQVLSGPFQPLGTIGCTNELTVGRSTPRPSNNRRALSAVVVETDTPPRFTVETSSLPVVSSSLCIEFSIDCKTLPVSLVGRPDFGSGVMEPCASK